MATLTKKKLAALNKENCEEHLGSTLAQNSNVPRSQKNYITQFCKEIEGRVTRKFSQEISKTKNRILGALSRLDDFLLNPLNQGHSGSTQDTSEYRNGRTQGTSEDASQSDLHPETGIFHKQTKRNWHRRWRRHGDRTSCGSHILLLLYIFRKAEKEPLHQSNRNFAVRISQRRL